MSKIWNASEYDLPRKRLIPCFDLFYSTAADLVAVTVKSNAPAMLDLGAGTGILSEFVARKIPPASLTLLDESPDMLAKAEERLTAYRPKLKIQKFTDPLPTGKFDAIFSALAIHHLPDEDKRDLFARVYQSLMPGGIFVNAEQVLGPSLWHEKFYNDMHLNGARALGSSEEEIQGAVERMKFDKCATLENQVSWLEEVGFKNMGTFFQHFRFAVYAGWKE